MNTPPLRAKSSLRLLIDATRLTIDVYGSVLARGATRLLALHVLEAAAGQVFSYATEQLRMSGREDLIFIAFIAMFELAFSMLWSAAWALAVVDLADSIWRGQYRTGSYYESFKRYFNQIVIEEVRSLAAVLWRVPLLILPSIYEYMRLTFVPLVVILNPNYSRGEVDALTESRRLCRGRILILTFVILASLITPWTVQVLIQGERGDLVWENPLAVSMGWLVALFINVFSSTLLWAFFRGIFSEVPDAAPSDNMPANSTIVVS